ncbi:MAG: hypothetical protein JXK07_05020 [Spirochaetes bacterium]|nr:hypothetical protein [Spirochaetota bacterium]MBN2769586.1 hypothetical protein [Spirochaetota bacterium]
MSICDYARFLRIMWSVPSIKAVLKKGYRQISLQDQEKIRDYLQQSQCSTGGFTDRNGREDIYYTFFGTIIADSLSIRYDYSSVAKYIGHYSVDQETSLADMISYAALLYKHTGNKKRALSILSKIDTVTTKKKIVEPVYADIMMTLACLQCRLYFRAAHILKSQAEQMFCETAAMTPLVAARVTMISIYLKKAGLFKKKESAVTELKRHAESCVDVLINRVSDVGGFKASAKVIVPDLLSTAVSLYALKCYDYDLRAIAPSMLDFITSVYCDGSFAPSEYEAGDVEYLFYGLLALGSL